MINTNRRQFLLKIFPLAIAITFGFFFNLKGQDSKKAFFQSYQNAIEQLSTIESQRYNKLQSSVRAKNITIVTLPDNLYSENLLSIWVNPKTESIVFNPKGEAKEVLVYRESVEIISEKEYVWLGIIKNPLDNSKAGNITLVVQKNSSITGSIDIDGAFYEIHSLGGTNKHALMQVDMMYIDNVYKIKPSLRDTRNPITNKGAFAFDYQTSMPRCTPNIQKVLAVYTPNAANGRNMSGIISLAIQEANEAYANSAVNNVRLALAHQQQVAFLESPHIMDDMDELKTNPTIGLLRNQHNADIVVLFTDGNYSQGVGFADAIFADQFSAFAIVEADFVSGPDYTFAHEVGHLQGAQHHPEDGIEWPPIFLYGFGHKFSYKPSIFKPRVRKSTVMAYPFSPFNLHTYSGVKHFSNPNISYSGEPTGIANERENYKVLNNTAEILADFRNPNELNAFIHAFDNGNNYTFSANVCGGNSEYSYEWRLSATPHNFGVVQSTNPTYTPLLPEGTWYIKLTTTSGSQSTDAYTSVNVSGGCYPLNPCLINPLKIMGNAEENDKNTDYTLLQTYPNPFNPTTHIVFSVSNTQQVKLSVFDLSGRQIAILTDGIIAAGRHSVTFNASDLSSGVYIVHLQIAGASQSKRITLIK